mgnify:CR=1 FL=1
MYEIVEDPSSGKCRRGAASTMWATSVSPATGEAVHVHHKRSVPPRKVTVLAVRERDGARRELTVAQREPDVLVRALDGVRRELD